MATPAEILTLLQTLSRHLREGNEVGQRLSLEQLGANLFEARTLILALGVGEIELLAFLAQQAARRAPATPAFRVTVEACRLASQRSRLPGAKEANVKSDLAKSIFTAFGPAANPVALRQEIKAARPATARTAPGPIADPRLARLFETAGADLKLQRWEPALEACKHLLARLGDKAPRPVYAMMSTCLHRLGRYPEAEMVARHALGPNGTVIAPLPLPPPESAIRARWKSCGKPRVSIVCTAFNHERYIEDALRGFLGQETTFPFEILVHDDASSDRTAAVIARWQSRYPNLIRATLQTENQYSKGIRPFELLLAQSSAPYVASCEGDDYWVSPHKLQAQVDFLERNPDFSCASHNYYLYNEARLSIHLGHKPHCERIIPAEQLMSLESGVLWVPTLVFRRNFSTLPPERELAGFGDQFLTSLLGTYGKCLYEEGFLGTVRRENQYSIWTPMAERHKETLRVKTWLALVKYHHDRSRVAVATQLFRKVAGSPLRPAEKSSLVEQSAALREVWDHYAPPPHPASLDPAKTVSPGAAELVPCAAS